ncbi:MAG TPA: cytochrome c oxidase subunit II [Solirubrobacteraceae bacterium]|nr:cytochrome c oxidase subunit II [Solirubrobacteraceae bacterium]
MRNRPVLQMVVFGVVVAAIGIFVALIIPWFPSQGSVQAGRVHTLYDVLLICTVPIFVLVGTVILFSVWKFRMRPGQEEMDGPPIHGNTRLEVVWTALPALLILSLCGYAYSVLRANEATKKNEMTVNVTTRQFAFEFSYPDAGKQVVSSELYLPIHQPVVFKIRSLDVIHSFFVPNFSEKLDAVPGLVTTLRVTPSALGVYPVECTELCGAGHSLMRSSAHVVTETAFQAWVRAQPANAPPPVGTVPPNVVHADVPGYNVIPGYGSSSSSSSSTPAPSSSSTSSSSAAISPAAAAALFTSAGCSGCHTLAAASATGTVGPDLDTRLRSDCANPASQKVRGAALKQCIYTAITKPYAYIPSGYSSGIMPPDFAQRLTSAQIAGLVNFLASAAK